MNWLLSSYEYLEQGGWIMIPLALCSLFMWMLIFERAYAFQMLNRDIKVNTALRVLSGEKVELKGQGLNSRLVTAFLGERSGIPSVDADILRQIADHMRRDLGKFLAVIAVLASVAPILGLLGTVLGMIKTFDVISVFGTGNAKAMAGGISVALVTTQTGLLVAIPGLLLSGMLARQSRRLTVRLDEVTEILARFIHQKAGGVESTNPQVQGVHP